VVESDYFVQKKTFLNIKRIVADKTEVFLKFSSANLQISGLQFRV
jgi:hypothetical protein